MPHSWGYRARTKTLFQRGFRQHGMTPLSTYMRKYKLGQYVDIKVNSSIHKGMPHKFYHGRTGRIWDIANRAIGVEVNKRVGNRIIKKRIHVRVDHLKPSRCRDDFVLRMKTKSGKRKPRGPRRGGFINVPKGCITTIHPKPYALIV
ncbi:putative Ribosomal protein L21e [Monocercomonoides exilis]|uniref:putative Ribosomal protein L21e n=1 Tax=Monocercomonoides exilis TaxID=2049356 RepID=UPI00355A69B7|nr:putative Ribosomal protein L21e [Monocercomonoides exilis]KAH7831489.1 putative Ribosomal protein L21e [Monocercomonoides exilis]|eukprot:MONOS_1773.1-p1 / transcript=MONOS_1773.1 / gene=MONOS_1773 / organism=Monocercomonoides_exilis_PA203 / gene_product=Ribosomal protein L21e / transcript_product=Ribosomal protein L21e / location=Mono_scaffold00033:62333-62957(+) / protein_length=147 / sequence_SO=supercontig / SO=protein_coding / is_pseudo=false